LGSRINGNMRWSCCDIRKFSRFPTLLGSRINGNL